MSKIRVCNSCKRSLLLTEYFHRCSLDADGFSKTCKDCRSQQQRKHYLRRKFNQTKSGRRKPLSSLFAHNYAQAQTLENGTYKLRPPGYVSDTHELSVQRDLESLEITCRHLFGEKSLYFSDKILLPEEDKTFSARFLAEKLTQKLLQIQTEDKEKQAI